MSKEYAMVRLWKNTRKKLKYLSAITGNTMIQIVDDLASKEIAKRGYADRFDKGESDES